MRGNLQLNTTPAEVRNGTTYILIDQDPNNAFFNRFRWRIDDGTADYHGLRMSLSKRFSQGFQVQTSYTWSRSIDDGSAFLGSGDFTNDRQPYRTGKEVGLSAFDIRHSFYTNFVVDLPGGNLPGVAGSVLGGWSLSSILRMNTGSPNSVTSDRPRKTVPGGTRQMIFVDGPSVDAIPGGNLSPIRSQNPDSYIDLSQFLSRARLGNDDPERYALGNVGVNTLIGPGIVNADMTLSKTTKLAALRESAELEFRFELFNIFNRRNFQDPSTNQIGRAHV